MNYNYFRQEKMKALKEKDIDKNKVITNLLSAMTYMSKEMDRELTEEDCITVVQKQLKQAREALEMISDRPEHIEKINQEISILMQYLPEQMSIEEIKATLYPKFSDLGLEQSFKSKGVCMKEGMSLLKGKADGKDIAKVVDEWIKGNA